MISTPSDAEIEDVSVPIRCAAQISDSYGSRSVVVRVAHPGLIRMELPSGQAGGISPGDVVQVESQTPPLGPIRASAKVESTESSTDHRGRPALSALLRLLDLSKSQRNALKSRLESLCPVAVLLGFDPSPARSQWESLRIIEAADAEDGLRYLDQEDVAVLALGPRLPPDEARAILARSVVEFPGNCNLNIVAGVGASADLFQEFIDDDRIFYLSRGPLSDAHLRSLVVAAASRFRAGQESAEEVLSAEAKDRLVEFCARLSVQPDAATAGSLLAEAAREEFGADTVQCLLYDSEKQVLTSADGTEPRVETAAAGLAGYIARTAESIRLDRVGDDPRYDVEADNPGGRVDACFLAEPLFGPRNAVIGVVSAVRSEGSPFSAEDAHRMASLAACAAPTLGALLFQSHAQTVLQEQAHAAGTHLDIFRQEALDFQTKNWDQEGDVLQSVPAWLRKTHWLTIALVVCGLVYMVLAKVDETATGPVVVRARSKIALTATTGGLVRSVEVAAGDRVRMGDLLLRFYDAPGSTSLERLKGQLRAPADGLVSDILVRPGQQVGSGDQVASIVDESAGYELIAMLPGSYAPQIHPGMDIVLKLVGYPDSHEVVAIERVGTEIVGPHEAARYAGRESTDALTVAGPVLIVRSTPPPKFSAGDRSYAFHDGMTGEGEVRVRSERMIVSLVPGLENLFRSKT
jgi:membrane fusion protein (multidrug efflux system)